MKFAFISPSGSGKTTIINLILKKFKSFSVIKSYTSRLPRSIEDNEYIFVSREEFIRLNSQGFFLESEEIFSNFYGTPYFEEENVIFNIDINGFYNLKKFFNLVSIGIIASPEEIEKRLNMRGDTNIQERIQRYSFEIEKMKDLEFLVLNKNLDEAIKIVENIFEIYLHRRQVVKFFELSESRNH